MAGNDDGGPWADLESLASVIDLCRNKGVTRLSWAGLSIELSSQWGGASAATVSPGVDALEQGLAEFAQGEGAVPAQPAHWRSSDHDARFRHSRIKPVDIRATKAGVGVGE